MRALRAFWAAMAVALAGSAAAEAAERAAPDTWEPKDYRRVPTAVRWSRRVRPRKPYSPEDHARVDAAAAKRARRCARRLEVSRG